jgi:hypothetical protein
MASVARYGGLTQRTSSLLGADFVHVEGFGQPDRHTR